MVATMRAFHIFVNRPQKVVIKYNNIVGQISSMRCHVNFVIKRIILYFAHNGLTIDSSKDAVS